MAMTTESGCCDGRIGNGSDSVRAKRVFGENEQLILNLSYESFQRNNTYKEVAVIIRCNNSRD